MKEIGSGVVNLGLEPNNDTYVGVYGSSSVNYALCMYAAWPYSMVPIGIYDSLGRDGVKFIIQQSAARLIYADNLDRVRSLLEWKDENSPLKNVVSFLPLTDELIQIAKVKQINLMTLDELRERGRTNPVEFVLPKPTDIAVIMYTSGSTGEPKGCLISHDAFLCGVLGLFVATDLPKTMNTNEIPRLLNYMPLAHMFGTGTMVVVTFLGGETGFWQGRVEKLMDDFRDFKPTLLAMVPRLLNKLYDKVRSEVLKKGLIGRIIFRLAVTGKLALLRRGYLSQNTIWDQLLFNKVRQSFGGQVTRVISTSAPLSAQVCGFSRSVFSCLFIECYGQTECVIGCSQTPTDMEPGETGIPTTMNYIKLIDVPEKEYYAKDGIGEICFKSPAMFSGYLKDEEKTRLAVDEQGWLHTGDIGRLTPHKTMRIVDRKKNMYKLSQGEYVAPEKIEDVYARSPFISQLFVYGDSFESFLIAIIVLDEDYIKKWSAQNGNNTHLTVPYEKCDELKRIVLEDMTREGKKRGLMSYEQIKVVEFVKEPFTVENGLLTPTFKARRYAIEKKYKPVFEQIYKR